MRRHRSTLACQSDRRLAVGISLFARDGQAIWENGIHQNIAYLAMMLKRSERVGPVYFLNGGDARALPALKACLESDDKEVRCNAVAALGHLRGDKIDMQLLSIDMDGVGPWLDPREWRISPLRVQRAAQVLRLPEEQVSRQYGALAHEFDLQGK